MEKLGPVAYKLQLPDATRIHTIFHVSLLKPYYQHEDAAIIPTTKLPPFTNEGVVMLEPQKILDMRWVKQGAKMIEQSLVQWKYIPVKEATWEPTSNMREMFPSLNLED